MFRAAGFTFAALGWQQCRTPLVEVVPGFQKCLQIVESSSSIGRRGLRAVKLLKNHSWNEDWLCQWTATLNTCVHSSPTHFIYFTHGTLQWLFSLVVHSLCLYLHIRETSGASFTTQCGAANNAKFVVQSSQCWAWAEKCATQCQVSWLILVAILYTRFAFCSLATVGT